jgi:hypothetical protein
MAFIATYDIPEADASDRQIVRIARTWLRIMKSKAAVQGIVNRVVEELYDENSPGNGCGWDDLRDKFTAWALNEACLEAIPAPSSEQ